MEVEDERKTKLNERLNVLSEDDISAVKVPIRHLETRKVAEDIFIVQEDTLIKAEENIANAMKNAIRFEVWNMLCKGNHLVERRKLLKDKDTRENIINIFFKRNKIEERLPEIVQKASQSLIDDFNEEHLLRADIATNVSKTGSIHSTRAKESKATENSHNTRKRIGKRISMPHKIRKRRREPMRPFKNLVQSHKNLTHYDQPAHPLQALIPMSLTPQKKSFFPHILKFSTSWVYTASLSFSI